MVLQILNRDEHIDPWKGMIHNRLSFNEEPTNIFSFSRESSEIDKLAAFFMIISEHGTSLSVSSQLQDMNARL